MRISDWSSDVCSSDLRAAGFLGPRFGALRCDGRCARRVAQDAVASHRRDAHDDARRAARRGYQSGAARVASAWLSCHRAADGGQRRSANGQYNDPGGAMTDKLRNWWNGLRSEDHTSELQSLMRISYAVFCLQKKKTISETI